MIKQICLVALLLTCRICIAQNLVANGDLEQYNHCPTNGDQLDTALFWYNPTTTSPDYFNQCSSQVGVPVNGAGFQTAHSGNGYAGICPLINSNTNYREYLEVALMSTLTSDTCYHFEMFVNLANVCGITTNDIGVYFSDTLIKGTNAFFPLQLTAQINNTVGFISDTLNWTLVSGNFTATGGENYLIIGNFKNDANTGSVIVNNTGSAYVFFYIDDVSLTKIPPCYTGISNPGESVSAMVFPNPFNDKLNITIKSLAPVEVTLYDVTSRKLLQQSFTNATSLNTEQLAKGIYLYEVRNKNGVIKKGKVVKE